MKVLHTAATIISAVAAAVAPFLPPPFNLIAYAVAISFGVIAVLTKPKIKGPGTQTQFTADPSAGIPYPIGRTAVAGNIVHQGSYGADNKYQSFVIDWGSGGPHDSFEAFQVDKATITFSGGNAVGDFHDWMWLTTALGTTPQAAALSAPFGGFGGWSSSSKISGNAHGIWTLKYDPKGKKYPSGVPKPLMVGKWAKVYDPRLDSTYPGGSGSHRALDESTYTWSDNPWLHALTWALGRWQNGKRVLGVGIAVASIVMADYVEAANIADVNGWKLGGIVYSTDDKWAVMKAMCQAGGGEPMRLGAMLSCFVNTPRVSLATITADDLADGDISVTAMQPRRDRINGVIARYRSESHDWEMVSADPIHVADYVTQDGGERTREVEYPLVQDVDQAATLARYDIENAREFGPITMPLKPFWVGYKPGDCLTIDIAETGMEGQDVIVMGRSFDPATGAVTPTMRSETSAKHAYALGQTGTAPPTPSLSAPVDVPLSTVSQVAALIATSTTRPTRVLEASESGGSATVTVIAHDRIYQDGVTVPIPESVFTGLVTDHPYFPYYVDLTRSDTNPTIVMTDDSGEAQLIVGAHPLGRIRTPISGSDTVYVGGGSYPPGGGGGREIDGPLP